MAPLSRAGIISLVALTLHFSVLSLTLHVARKTTSFHASSAIFLTELFKIVLAGAITLWTGELRPRVMELKRSRAELEERQALAEANEPAWIAERQEKSGSDTDGDEHHDWMQGRGHDSVSSATSPTRRKNSVLRVDVGLAQGTLATPMATPPSLSVIPATPAPEASPTMTPDLTALYPNRPPLALFSSSAFDDFLDWDWWTCLVSTVFGDDCWQLAVIAACYTIQGNLQYIASGNLSVPLFQLAYQLKIPATAMFSVVLLHRTLSQQQWSALFILTSGVGIVQLYSVTAAKEDELSSSDAMMPLFTPNAVLGLTSVVIACLSSGFASCYFEKILKAPHTTAVAQKPSIWIRNVQLSTFGLATGLPVVLWESRSGFVNGGWKDGSPARAFFDGFNTVTWIVILLQVTGGLLGAVVIQYADNLLKCFSTSLSILISVVLSVFLFDFQVSLGMAVGGLMVLAATYFYTSPIKTLRWRWRPGDHSRAPSSGHPSVSTPLMSQ